MTSHKNRHGKRVNASTATLPRDADKTADTAAVNADEVIADVHATLHAVWDMVQKSHGNVARIVDRASAPANDAAAADRAAATVELAQLRALYKLADDELQKLRRL